MSSITVQQQADGWYFDHPSPRIPPENGPFPTEAAAREKAEEFDASIKSERSIADPSDRNADHDRTVG
ncbi:hypothetical protein [Schumannella sp. 10F1B-5-1]|uniref:hypothetical protein n=1 Tax=Schumannella sp. 10F1B-5-1 TaxID=2590780 RepID=UPI001130FF73|nr:hypothetical protein [Schumannella sp. 10F1B-5-1]TPW70904.1 hypothetical protein FJ658_12420 [Schumannella sp. 10F1B-5-1]